MSGRRIGRPAEPVSSDAEAETLLKDLLSKIRQIDTKRHIRNIRNAVFCNDGQLAKMADMLYDMAVDEPTNTSRYAAVCLDMCQLRQPSSFSSRKENERRAMFRELLLTRCQHKFEAKPLVVNLDERQREIEAQTDPAEKRAKQRVLEEAQRQARLRYNGCVHFIGELYNAGVLSNRFTHQCIVRLVNDRNDYSYECVCILLTVIRHKLELADKKRDKDLGQMFADLERLARDENLCSRIRFKLRDLIELRSNQWVPTRNALKTGFCGKVNERYFEDTDIESLIVKAPERQNLCEAISQNCQTREGRPEFGKTAPDTCQRLFRHGLDADGLLLDSQTKVKDIREIKQQCAEKVEQNKTENAQLSSFENFQWDDKLGTEKHCADSKQLREEYAEKFAGMCERIEAFEKRHCEDQTIINEYQRQLAVLSTQLTQSTENRRLDLDQFKRCKLDRHRELACQQLALASCQTRLEQLRSATSRQRECLLCSICLGLFSRPMTLNCGHTFCEVCIESNRHSAVPPDSCPLCRQFIATSVRSAVVGQLAEITQVLEQ